MSSMHASSGGSGASFKRQANSCFTRGARLHAGHINRASDGAAGRAGSVPTANRRRHPSHSTVARVVTRSYRIAVASRCAACVARKAENVAGDGEARISA